MGIVGVAVAVGDRHPINSKRETAARTVLRNPGSTLLLSRDSSLSTYPSIFCKVAPSCVPERCQARN